MSSRWACVTLVRKACGPSTAGSARPRPPRVGGMEACCHRWRNWLSSFAAWYEVGSALKRRRAAVCAKSLRKTGTSAQGQPYVSTARGKKPTYSACGDPDCSRVPVPDGEVGCFAIDRVV
ncbi:hypothetical protein CLOP_g5016 [Closterium sp. NIES-67]|nr:hypothetical protein CLOP_g5016 [Closterium sp. NIES-67]